MRKVILIMVAGILMVSGRAEAVPSWAVPAALRFISNPDDFFFNLHLDNVDYSPSAAETKGGIRMNLLLTTLPLTWANLNVKAQVLNESSIRPWTPQVDIVGSYGRIAALDILPAVMDDDDDDDFETPTMSDYSIGLTLTKAVSPETRLFAGYHHSVFALDIEFDEVDIAGEETIDSLNISRRDNILVTGISNRFGERSSMTAYLGYGFNYNKIFSRVVWHRRRFELGFNIYPEGLLVIHPFIGMHWGL